MVKQAWYTITSETIKHCWNHTEIQLDPTVGLDSRPHVNPAAWNIIRKFMTTEMSLPAVENDLKAHLCEHYVDSDWRPALKAIMDAKGDTDIALNAVNALAEAVSHHTGLKICIPVCPQQADDQLSSAEADLMQSVNNLKARNCIFGQLPTLDELLDPAEERDMGEFPAFEGGDKAIADEVHREVTIASGEVIETDSDDDNDNDDSVAASITWTDLLDLCQQLKVGCMQYGNPPFSLNLSSQLRIFRACHIPHSGPGPITHIISGLPDLADFYLSSGSDLHLSSMPYPFVRSFSS
ncbi:uncharacterized protein F5147DRAFT_776530 [Suillus discolor]|uniref:Uncharacterized protein n=1 Tax=Suillus discolor TaxID=1912936 RepID=A0A9P7F229_9AGAM|nr:uncharacterized protein F5147DRAFT_776530 [Suillus discolor]KAG2101876.1 hypothetical protein F5147DRAFT_776530 [Suillus discolor]